MTVLFPNRQILVARESAEGSQVSAGSLGAGALVRVIDPRIRPIANSFERPLASPGFGTNPDHFSTASMEVTFGVELSGDARNTSSYTNTPGWSKLLEACGFNRVDLYALALTSTGSITDGPFQHLEGLTGDTAGEAVALGYSFTGDNNLSLSGVQAMAVTGPDGGPGGSVGGAPTAFTTSEAVDGDRSGASATAVGTTGLIADARIGDAWYPITTEVENKSLTMHFNVDGQRYQMYGCRGNVEFNLAAHDRIVMQFTFLGIFDEADESAPVDEFQTGAFNVKNPPGLKNASAKFVTREGSPKTLSGTSFCWSNATLNAGANVAMRDCANGANGYQAAVIANRDPRFTINPDDPGVATMPFVQNMLDGTLSRFRLQIGDTLRNSFGLQLPYLQTADLAPEPREERHTFSAQMKATRGLTDGADGASIGQDNEILLTAF